MSTEALSIGVSGLLAYQRSLSTITHNIANANTEGYSRQRVDYATRDPQQLGNGYQGKGVDVSTVTRMADSFINRQLESTLAGEARHSAYAEYAGLVEQVVSNPETGVGAALSKFFNALQDVNNDPTSSSARTVFLGAAEELATRMNGQGDQLSFIDRELNREISNRVTEINDKLAFVADLNDRIVSGIGLTGQPPNDLLDQRDQALRDLSELAGVSTIAEADGSVSVTLPAGLTLVSGPNMYSLGTVTDPSDSSRLEVTYNNGGSQTLVSQQITRGRLGGLLAAREDVLTAARDQLGRVAASMTYEFNAQHRAGMDLGGQLGGDLFAVDPVIITELPGNASSISVTLDPTQSAAFQAADYRLRHDGTNFQLTQNQTGVSTTLAGAGPFTVDGMTISVTGVPANGDEFEIRPVRNGANTMRLAITDPNRIAVASPVRSEGALSNLGNGTITPPTVTDATNPALTSTVSINFVDGSNYQINGAGPLIAWSPGDTVNAAGVGDNRNGQLLAELQQKDIIGGSASFEEGYAEMVGQVGSRTQRANVALTSMTALRESAEASREKVSGVNLDEEAANLLKYQQAYQAAAQVISVTNTLFDSLLNAIGN